MLIPKETANEAYPKKQVVTWIVSQLLWRAGTRGVILASIPGIMEVRAMAKKGKGRHKDTDDLSADI